jgi:hypothetical protein
MRIDQILGSDKLTQSEREFLHSILYKTWSMAESNRVQQIGRHILKREKNGANITR